MGARRHEANEAVVSRRRARCITTGTTGTTGLSEAERTHREAGLIEKQLGMKNNEINIDSSFITEIIDTDFGII